MCGGIGVLNILYFSLFKIMVFSFRNEALRVAFIHVEESGGTDGKGSREFYSKLVKADVNGKDQVNKRFSLMLMVCCSFDNSL